jgi:cytochrome P450
MAEVSIAAEIAFDPFSPEVLAAGPVAYAALKKQTPFYHYQGEFDFYITSDNKEIKDVLKDYETFSFRFGSGPRDAGGLAGQGIATDPPIHDKFRAILQGGFSPANLRKLSKHIDRIADDLIDKMLADPKGEGDFFEVFSMPLPVRVMCTMLGAPESDYLKYKAWAHEEMTLMMNAKEVGAEHKVAMEFAPHFFGLISERRAMLRNAGIDTPRPEHVGTVLPDDFMSRYICARVDDRPLNDEEALGLGVTVLTAGSETTINLVTNLLWRLLEVPGRWETLKKDPSLVEAAIEESLRFDPPVLGHCRKVIRPTELDGHSVPAGARVMYNIAGANRDPAIWDNPDEFRLDRPLDQLRKNHIAFGGGHHLCVGLHFARMEVKQVLEKLLARLPNLRLTGKPTRIEAFCLWGRSSLPLAWK